MGSRPMNSKNGGRSLALSAAALTMLLAGQAASADARWLSGEPVRLEPAFMQPGQLAQDLTTLASRDDAKRVLVHFDAPLTDAKRVELREAGLELLHFAGDGVFFATLNAKRLDVDAVVNAGAGLTSAWAIQPRWKKHPLLINRAIPDYAVTGTVQASEAGEFAEAGEPIVAAYLMLHRDADPIAGRALLEQRGVFVVDRIQSVNGFVIEAPMTAIDSLAEADDVLWMEAALPQFSTMNTQNRQLTQVNDVAGSPLNLTGAGVTAFVYDGGRIRPSHVDFEGRASVIDGSGQSNHATHVAGTVGGGGPNGGMAPDVNIVSAGFETGGGAGIFLYSNPGDFEADYSNAFNNHNADISNNSIGTNTSNNGFPCDITGEYGLMASLIDAAVTGSLTNGSPIRVVWANGNERGNSRCGDLYNTTAPPGGAKNHITVGALNANNDSMTSFSSWGPVNDGRIKPDISAPGCEQGGDNGVSSLSSSSDTSYSTLCGTSMASPTVAGIGALLIEHHRNLYPGAADLRNSTLKAILAQTAADRGNPGPDYQFGYGSVRANDAALLMLERSYAETSVAQGSPQTFSVVVAPGSDFKATIAWDDAPAIPNVSNSLVNNLDLVVTDPNGVRHYPWTLDPANPASNAVRVQEDSVNNIEQVFVENAASGVWTVEIRDTNVSEGPQPVSLATSGSLVALTATLQGGVPELVSSEASTTLTLNVFANGQDVVSGSANLHYRFDGGSFTTVPMASSGPFAFSADLPPAQCDNPAEFFFTVSGTASGEIQVPSGGAASPYSAPVGSLETVVVDDFSANTGWTVGAPDDDAVSGIWERVNPIGTSAQPNGALIGEFCFVTGQQPAGDQNAGANDVDAGKTTLFSPEYDLSGYNPGELTMSYWRWYSNSAGASPNVDVFEVDISDDGGQTWTTLEVVGPTGSEVNGGWFQNAFDPADFVGLTDRVMLRFVASDNDPQALIEAAVDGMEIVAQTCANLPSECTGDADNSGTVDLDDLDIVLSNFGQQTSQGDLDENGVVNLDDLDIVLSNFGTVCN